MTQSNNNLGIYLSETGATVVCVDASSKDKASLACFNVKTPQDSEEPAGIGTLAEAVGTECSNRNLEYAEAYVAIDSSLFMQHQVRSNFSDIKQISSTIKYDAEETLAMDVNELAVAFKVINSDEAGSNLHFFTAKQDLIAEVIKGFAAGGIDPVSIEPDVSSISRFLEHNKDQAESYEGAIYAFFSDNNGYLIAFDQQCNESLLRGFVVGSSDGRAWQVKNQIRSSLAILAMQSEVSILRYFDSTKQDSDIGTGLACPAEKFDIKNLIGEDSGEIDAVKALISWGSALGHLEKNESLSFRHDFMPYQGKRKLFERTVKILGVVAAVLVISLGAYLQADYMRKTEPIGLYREKLGNEYKVAMPGRKFTGDSKSAESRLGKEIRRIENIRSGRVGAGGKLSIPAQLTLVLESFNKCAKETRLEIDSVNISTKIISVVGSTSGRANTQKLRKAIEHGNLKILQDRLEVKGARDHFTLTLVPKKAGE